MVYKNIIRYISTLHNPSHSYFGIIEMIYVYISDAAAMTQKR